MTLNSCRLSKASVRKKNIQTDINQKRGSSQFTPNLRLASINDLVPQHLLPSDLSTYCSLNSENVNLQKNGFYLNCQQDIRMQNDRKVVLFIAISMDGHIARKNGDIDWLSIVEDPKEDYGYKEFIKSVDTVIMGRKTYDKVRSFDSDFPHPDKKCYVISRSKRSSDKYVEFYRGDVRELINEIRQQDGLNIFLDGGAQVVNEFMMKDLIDEYIISIIPVLLGSGIPLFGGDTPEIRLRLRKCKTFSSGLVQLFYSRSK